MATEKFSATELREAVIKLDSLRGHKEKPIDISLSDYLKDVKLMTLEQMYSDLGVNPAQDTIQNIVNLPDPAMRWLLPEIFRDALRLGLRKAPIYPNIIISEESLPQLQATVPYIQMSDAGPKKTGIGQTIQVGDVAFGSKTIKFAKIARGIKLPYEMKQFVSLDVVSIFLQDFGVKLGQALDCLAIDCLLNGEQTDGSESAAVVGIGTANSLTYLDFLKVAIRMARLGSNPTTILGGENSALTTLNLPEFKQRFIGTTYANLNVKTPLPQSWDYFVHGYMPTSQQIILDKARALIKYNVLPLLVESEKVVSSQVEAVYLSLTTGFAVAFRDARVTMDQTLAFGSGNGFPSWMDPSTQETVHVTY